MSRPKPPSIVDIDWKDVEELLQQAEALLPSNLFELLRLLVDNFDKITKLVRKHGTTIARLRRLFGLSGSEKLANVLPPVPPPSAGPGGADTTPGKLDENDVRPADDNAGAEADSDKDNAGAKPPESTEKPKEKAKVKGHGRVPASAYRAATHIPVPHATLHPGAPCPHCHRGKMYRLKEPAPYIRIFGQAPLSATCWDCERMRCSACGDVYTARVPEEAQGEKYDETAVSMIALQHYGMGTPFHRLERLQSDLETPVPASTQWDVVHERVEVIQPVHDELVRLAAQGTVVHNDDTHARILDFMGKRRVQLFKDGELPDPERTGLFTTAIVSISPERPAVAIFVTGRKHAGENLTAVLDKRDPDLPAPIQMSDALNRNAPEGHDVIESNCLAHARRKFVDELDNYPTECQELLEKLGHVYKVDKDCRDENLSAQDRLSRHQSKSAPLMSEIHQGMLQQLESKRIEENSGMGQAISYSLKHWNELTLFLREPGAPLDNNICERALKMPILGRKGSMFYRSQRGADVGDIYMTLIYTVELHGGNPFDYLTSLQRNAKAVAESPAEWLPWNYKDTLARSQAQEAAKPSRPFVPFKRPLAA